MPNIMRLGGGGGGAKLATVLNEDGTQNLLISDNGTVFDLASLTADADAAAEDVASGKVFYAQGKRLVGAANNDPVLLWENPNPTSKFAAQTVTINYSEYNALLIENVNLHGEGSRVYVVGLYFLSETVAQYLLNKNDLSSYGLVGLAAREVTFTNGNTVTFSDSNFFQTSGSGASSENYAIPTRIWGVKFTL